MKTLAVINPRSAGGRTGRDAELIARRLAEISGPLTVALTSGPLDAARITTRALLEGFERIVAVGGDGTINEVVNGFFHEGEVINPEAELSLLNMGTGGDFRKTFEMGAGLEPSLQRIAEGMARRIDVGCLSFVSPEGQSGKRYFANIASFGLSGEVVDRVNRGEACRR
jgi:diacylglycerol kinase family enzyme